MDAIPAQRTKSKLLRELGPVAEHLNDPAVVEIMLNHTGELFVEAFGKGMQKVGTMTASNAECLMATIATSLGTSINKEKPYVEGELITCGSRFEGLIPPIVEAPVFAIRKKASMIFTLDQYVDQGIMTPFQRIAINDAITARKNILVAGGTGSGKTTLLNAVIDQTCKIHPEHRMVIIEDTREIQCNSKNYVSLRTANNVNMDALLRKTMRLRPDRILVGEVRGGEALSLLKAWNTGHPGGVATLHADNCKGALVRLEQLISEVSQTPMAPLVAEAVGLVISITKTHAGGRVVNEIMEVTGFDNKAQCYLTEEVEQQQKPKLVSLEKKYEIDELA